MVIGRVLRNSLTFVQAVGMLLAQLSHARHLEPTDLFRIREVKSVNWSPDAKWAAIEISRPGRTLDRAFPNSELGLLNTSTGAIRTLNTASPRYLGFFNALWSPKGQQLTFLSIDEQAVMRLWVWKAGLNAPIIVPNLEVRFGFGDRPVAWIAEDQIAVIAWEPGAVRAGYFENQIQPGLKASNGWKLTKDGSRPSVAVMASGGAASKPEPIVQIIILDIHTGKRRSIARGEIHKLTVSEDAKLLKYFSEEPTISGQTVQFYFEATTNPEKIYDAVQWGTSERVLEIASGKETETPFAPLRANRTTPPAEIPPEVANARRISTAPGGRASLYVADGDEGSTLYLCGSQTCRDVWRGNQWLGEITKGRAESIQYRAEDGTELTGWLLLPADYNSSGGRLPMVTIVYPGSVFGGSQPYSISLYDTVFLHPQLFAALGYAVLMPSMPAPKIPADSHLIASLTNGVLPAVEAAVLRGIADPSRLAVIGNSAGGFATLGLLTRTTKFRSAVASASYGDLTSLYGTFYGQYRYGDAGHPQKAQVLRMLQMEKGIFAMGGPPWQQPERYRAGSPVLYADKVQTPLMLVHGDLDFIPIQQAEEFFTALYRQDKRVTLLRYDGEGHGISNRANVLDLWQRLANWLAETLKEI